MVSFIKNVALLISLQVATLLVAASEKLIQRFMKVSVWKYQKQINL